MSNGLKMRMGLLGMMMVTLAATSGVARADEVRWYNTSYVTKVDRATGEFTRRGLGNFSFGEVGVMVLNGNMAKGQIKGTMVYTFEDGSTIQADISGRQVEASADGRSRQAGDLEFTGGTGRFSGITGKATWPRSQCESGRRQQLG
jgi:hypothetical protein